MQDSFKCNPRKKIILVQLLMSLPKVISVYVVRTEIKWILKFIVLKSLFMSSETNSQKCLRGAKERFQNQGRDLYSSFQWLNKQGISFKFTKSRHLRWRTYASISLFRYYHTLFFEEKYLFTCLKTKNEHQKR